MHKEVENDGTFAHGGKLDGATRKLRRTMAARPGPRLKTTLTKGPRLSATNRGGGTKRDARVGWLAG